MTIEQFKMLKAVSELGTLKAAGEKIFKTQAAISKGLRQLESHLDVQLFDREGYRLILTVEGERIYQLALSLLKKANEIEDLSHHFTAGNEAQITIAFSSTFNLNKVLPTLEVIQANFPETHIILRQENLTGAIEALQNKQADIVITPVGDVTLFQKSLQSFQIAEGTSIRVAAPKLLSRHPDLRSVQELENEYQIIVQDSGGGTKGKTYGVEDGQRRWYVNDWSVKKTLILSGMGWGGIQEYMIADELKNGSLKKLELTDSKWEFQVKFYVIKNSDTLLGPVASTLWESLKSLALYTNINKTPSS